MPIRSETLLSAGLVVMLLLLAMLYLGAFAVARLIGASLLAAGLIALLVPYVAMAGLVIMRWAGRAMREPPTPV